MRYPHEERAAFSYQLLGVSPGPRGLRAKRCGARRKPQPPRFIASSGRGNPASGISVHLQRRDRPANLPGHFGLDRRHTRKLSVRIQCFLVGERSKRLRYGVRGTDGGQFPERELGQLSCLNLGFPAQCPASPSHNRRVAAHFWNAASTGLNDAGTVLAFVANPPSPRHFLGRLGLAIELLPSQFT